MQFPGQRSQQPIPQGISRFFSERHKTSSNFCFRVSDLCPDLYFLHNVKYQLSCSLNRKEDDFQAVKLETLQHADFWLLTANGYRWWR